jgi:hypothetical protein
MIATVKVPTKSMRLCRAAIIPEKAETSTAQPSTKEPKEPERAFHFIRDPQRMRENVARIPYQGPTPQEWVGSVSLRGIASTAKAASASSARTSRNKLSKEV